MIQSARKISSRVDDMVSSMYPPLDPRLLEARAAALTLAVVHLALIAKYECQLKNKSYAWIDTSLCELEVHMKVLINIFFHLKCMMILISCRYFEMQL